ncbi:MAG: hypothetical protein J7J06_03520 [Methanosarcinales archaeon]|nr:hypothetical protein [Methanosarcinales archaeon]
MGNQTSGNVALLCVILISIVNVYISPIYDGVAGFIAIFTLMLLTGLAVPVVHVLTNRAAKFAAYLLLGFSAYWAVGAATNLAQIEGDFIFKSFHFLPTTIFAMASAIVVLIAIVDSPRYGYGFAGMGFAIIVYNVTQTWNLDFVGGKPDMLLLALVFCSLIPLLWCYLLAGTAQSLRFSGISRFYATAKTGFLTLSLFVLLAVALVVSQTPDIDSFEKVKTFFSLTSGDILKLCWYYLLSHTVFVMIAFFANHLILNAFDIEKELTEEGEAVYHRAVAEVGELEAEVEEAMENPYKQVMGEMKDFQSEFRKGKLNRLACVQKIGKFRSELDLLVSKYEYGTRDDAENLLNSIEKNVEFSFK